MLTIASGHVREGVYAHVCTHEFLAGLPLTLLTLHTLHLISTTRSRTLDIRICLPTSSKGRPIARRVV
jgi:hypothetical protein